jgi:hypothetical protein
LRGITPHSPDDRVASIARSTTDVRVVSIPSGHPYPQRVTVSNGIELLPDPRPLNAPAGQWWPPVALDPAWIRANATEADLLHIHFGTESFSAAHLAACIAAARDAGWPVVFTVHDLEHPQLSDQADYRAQLDVLIPGADALITLTNGAAREILRRWKRTAIVLRHPAVLDDVAAVQSTTSTTIRVGMHLKDLRSNIDSVAMVTALRGAVHQLSLAGRDVTAEVRMHHRVRDEATRDQIRAIVAGSERVELLEHDRLDDSGLANAIASLDVAVLPYRHGTHSGWLELCWDLGTGIAAPEFGFYAEQHADGSVAGFHPDADGTSLAAAITSALDSVSATRPGTVERAAEMTKRAASRAAELELQAAVHAGLYRKLVRERLDSLPAPATSPSPSLAPPFSREHAS